MSASRIISFEEAARRKRGGGKGGGGARAAPAALPSEDALAVRLAAQQAADARYDHGRGVWYLWDGTRWRMDEVGELIERTRALTRAALPPTTGPHQEASVAEKLGRERVIRAVARLAQSDRGLAVTGAAFDRDPWQLGTPGGTVDLRTGELGPARPADLITRQCTVTPAPPGAVPARWLAFLDEATRGDPSLIRFLKCWCGYTLTGSTSEQKLVFIHGSGGNGKGVFTGTLRRIMGDYVRVAPMETFTASHNDRHSTELAMLRGARMVLASETEAGRAWAEARIKLLTGEDEITARFMRQDFFTFLPTFKLWLVGNHKPQLANVDRAIVRRLRLIPFVHEPATVDPSLADALAEEHAAILRWCIEGCLDWQAEGLPECDAVTGATAEYLRDQDTLGTWLAVECQVNERPLPAEPYKTATALLFRAWSAWCERANERPGSMKRFVGELEKRGFGRVRDSRARYVLGVRLSDETMTRTGAMEHGAW